MRAEWANAKRIVVKIGSSLLVDSASGTLKAAWLSSLCDDIAQLKVEGKEVIVVSSGAIALGRNVLKLPKGALKLEDSQAAAAVGQIALAHAYEDAFRARGMVAAQVLLTLGDTEERRRYLNARDTMTTLLGLGAVPVVNENDTVATSEIRYGDNDRLAARVAQMASADCLVLLSDVDGLYTADPRRDGAAEFIPVVEAITPDIDSMAGGVGSEVGSGGMATKIAAARIAVAAGCHMCIAPGEPKHPLRRIESGARCTWFVPKATPVAARKQWIAGSLKPSGRIQIDAGAALALGKGRSLLPAGVTGASGEFERGDAVQVVGPDGLVLAHGLSAYSREDVLRIMGRRSTEIEPLVGFRGRDEIIHRDDLVLVSP